VQSANAWIEKLAKQPAEEIVTVMVYGVYYNNLEDLLQKRDWEDVKQDLKALQDDVRSTKPAVEQGEAQALLLEYLAYPEEAKQRYLMLIRQFYQITFLPWAERIREISESAMDRFNDFFQADPEKFLRDYHKDDPIAFHNKTNFHVSFAAQVGNYRYAFGYPVEWIIFGAVNDQIFGETAEQERVELFFKAFSDKRRLEFIALLRVKPRYGKEIAESLGITPAAVTYHANFMFFLDLLEMKRSEHRIYYHLKEDKLRELLALASKVLLGD
ncbi:MAG: hypothetical protein K6T85_08585, partial [Gorillibacterium sp.]|nr:hypothetical protein [Gorillibacterium sp.]